MNSTIKNTDDMNATKPRSLALRVSAYLLSVLTILNPIAPAIASVLTDDVVQRDFDSNPVYISDSRSSFQYKSPEYIEWATSSAKSLGAVYQELLNDYSPAISEPTYIPIGVGDITTFIPIYTRYNYVGTPAVQARYVRTQLVALLGRNLIDSGQTQFSNEAAQINALYDNAINYAKVNVDGHRYGDRLERDQADSQFDRDMIWPELRRINNQDVIVPVVYLTSATVAGRKVTTNRTELPASVSLGSLTVKNTDVRTSRATFLEVVGDLNITRSTLSNDEGVLKITAGGKFDNASSIVSANNGDLIIGAKSIHNHTIVYRYDLGNEQGSRYGEIASLETTNGDLVLQSHGDIEFEGADASASNGGITFAANGNIIVSVQELNSSSDFRFGGGSGTRSQVSYLQSHITAEDTIKLMASGQIVLDAAEIVSGSGHIELLAGMGVSVVDRLGVKQSQASGKFGKKKVDESVYQTVAIRSLLDAGKGVILNTEYGDITLKAADITSGSGTSVSAKNGAVNLLMTTETDHYSYSSVKKGMFTIKTESRGHSIETGVPNSIVGGFAVESLNGVTVEYEGNPDLSLNEQLDEISGMQGMDWINDVRNSPDVDWNTITLAHEEWAESNTSLSPAFAAVVAIAVAVATSGAGSGLAATIMGGTQAAAGAMGAAIAAGTSAFISQATLAVANGAVNGDISGALDDFASEDTLKSIAVAMVTAGAIAEVDAAFFNVDATAVDGAKTAVDGASTAVQAQAGVDVAVNATNAVAGGMSLTAQVGQAVTHAAIRAGAQTLIAGGDFEDSFVQSLAQGALDTLGEKLANKIGGAKASGDINTASQLVAHAAVGCLVGGASATLSDGETSLGCTSGAGGAVIGEIIGLAHAESVKEDLSEWITENTSDGAVLTENEVMEQAMVFKQRGVDMAKLTSALTAFAVGGDVNIAADAGANAAENNAFFLIAIVAVAAYTSYVSYLEGGLHEGLQAIGRGDDPVAQAIGSTVAAGVELAAEEYPEQMQKTAQVLGAVGEKISAGVKVVMETEAGETVTRYWNEIPEADRNAIIGGTAVVTMIIPAGVVAKLKTLSKIDVDPGEWIKDPKHTNWDKVSESDREVLEREHTLGADLHSSGNPLLEDSIARNGNRFVHDQGPTPTCGHNACSMTLDSLGVPTDPARLVDRIPPSEGGINGLQLKNLFYKEGVNANFVGGRSVDRLKELTKDGRPVVVRIEGHDNFSHWVVVDGVTERQGKSVVAIRDSAGGKEYFSPVDTFNDWFTGDVVIPNP